MLHDKMNANAKRGPQYGPHLAEKPLGLSMNKIHKMSMNKIQGEKSK